MKSYEIGDSIHGHRIIAEARKVNDPEVIVKSARHKAQLILSICISILQNLLVFRQLVMRLTRCH